MPSLHTPICSLLGIEHPVVLAGMGGITAPSGPQLVAAVSNAGGLGVLGGAFLPAEELARWIDETRRLTDRPFGVDTILPFGPGNGNEGVLTTWEVPESHISFAVDFRRRHGLPEPQSLPPLFDADFTRRQIEMLLDERVPVWVAGLGDPSRYVEPMHAAGIKVGVVVGATRHAQKAVAGGVDFVVAQGNEGGGHNSRVGTMALIPQVADVVAGRARVLGAGGIMDGRGLAAALMLGADGAWCGSAFLATHEANIPEAQKQAVVAHADDDTVVTPTITGKALRSIKNAWTEEFEAAGLAPLPMPLQGLLAFSVMEPALREGRADVFPGAAGQGIGLVDRIRPAAQVLQAMITEAEALLAGGWRAHVQAGR